MDVLPELEIDESISQFYLDASEKHSLKRFEKKILRRQLIITNKENLPLSMVLNLIKLLQPF